MEKDCRMTKKQYELLIERVYSMWMNRLTRYKSSLYIDQDVIRVIVYECNADGTRVFNIEPYVIYAWDTMDIVTEKLADMLEVLSDKAQQNFPTKKRM